MFRVLEACCSQGEAVNATILDHLSRGLLPDGLIEDVKRFVEDGETIAPGVNDLGPAMSLELYTPDPQNPSARIPHYVLDETTFQREPATCVHWFLRA